MGTVIRRQARPRRPQAGWPDSVTWSLFARTPVTGAHLTSLSPVMPILPAASRNGVADDEPGVKQGLEGTIVEDASTPRGWQAHQAMTHG